MERESFVVILFKEDADRLRKAAIDHEVFVADYIRKAILCQLANDEIQRNERHR